MKFPAPLFWWSVGVRSTQCSGNFKFNLVISFIQPRLLLWTNQEYISAGIFLLILLFAFSPGYAFIIYVRQSMVINSAFHPDFTLACYCILPDGFPCISSAVLIIQSIRKQEYQSFSERWSSVSSAACFSCSFLSWKIRMAITRITTSNFTAFFSRFSSQHYWPGWFSLPL